MAARKRRRGARSSAQVAAQKKAAKASAAKRSLKETVTARKSYAQLAKTQLDLPHSLSKISRNTRGKGRGYIRSGSADRAAGVRAGASLKPIQGVKVKKSLNEQVSEISSRVNSARYAAGLKGKRKR